MKKIIYIIPILLLVGLTVCLKPPRDNEWDPNNPDKATMRGYVFGLLDQPIPNAEVFLMQDTVVACSTTSGADGYYEINRVDPGFYCVYARAPHYLPFSTCEPESLPAGTIDTFDIWFCAQYYCFEEEVPGTVQPYGFDTVSGIWAVIQDGSQPENHSTPNVYHGEKTAVRPALSILRNSGPDFHLETTFKVIGGSGSGWLTGVVFGYHGDTLNFYFVGITHTGVGLHKRVNGIDSLIQAQPHSTLFDNWYDLTVQMCGQEIHVNFDGLEMNYTDANPFAGKAGFWLVNPSGPAMVNFDDVIIGH